MNQNYKSIFALALSLSLFGCSQETDTNTQEESIVQETENQDDSAKEQDVENENQEVSQMNIEPNNQESLTVLANKNNALDESQVPSDLVTIDVPYAIENPEVRQLREEASEQLSIMFDEALSDGIELIARSGYRSYNTQEELYTNYVNANGQEAADRFSARPGTSEHQTGLAMDITSESVDLQLVESFEDVPEGEWLAENAHRFGFHLRYPEGKENITGYQFEPWHYRYFGEDLATHLYENGLTYEEFLEQQ